MEVATVIGAVVRAGLQFAAGAVGATAYVNGDELTAAAGALTLLITMGWSIYQKKKAAK